MSILKYISRNKKVKTEPKTVIKKEQAKHKIYRSIDQLPYYNYWQIQNSLGKGKPAYNWLYVFDNKTEQPPKIQNYKELHEVYKNLVYDLPDINLYLNKLNIEIQKELLLYKIRYNKYKNYLNLDIEAKVPQDSKILHLYADYIRYINNNFTDFEFEIWSINEDFEEIYKKRYKDKETKLLELLRIHKNDQFLLYDELKFYFNEFVALINPFLKKIDWKTDSVSVIDKHIASFYKTSKNWEYFIFARDILFNLNTLKCKPKESKLTYFDEIDQLNKLIKNQIKPFEVTVSEYFSIRRNIPKN